MSNIGLSAVNGTGYNRGVTAITNHEPGLRERTRRAVRSELIAVAMDLFREKGFDATTIEEVAAAAGMSRRSFFRYFPSKEDVVLGHLDDLGEAVAAALTARPEGEDAWTALRRAFDVLVADTEAEPVRTLALMRMLDTSAVLKARFLERQMRLQEPLILEIAERLGLKGSTGGVDPRPRAVIGAAQACIEAALEAWMAADGAPPVRDLLDDAMRAVRPGSL